MSDMKIKKPMIEIENIDEVLACRNYCKNNNSDVEELIFRLGCERALDFIKMLKDLSKSMSIFCLEMAICDIIMDEYSISVLDSTEYNYLKEVIKPFKHRIKFVEKKARTHDGKDYEYIRITLENGDLMLFPNFEVGSMYKEMVLKRQYSLKELGL